MDGQRFIHRLRVQNLLSFGSEGIDLELQPLNVLIGANASGKSNLIETIGLLRATPRDLTKPIREGGGIAEWLWKGSTETPVAEIEAVVSFPEGGQPLRHRLRLSMTGQRLDVSEETIETASTDSSSGEIYFFNLTGSGDPELKIRMGVEGRIGTNLKRTARRLRRETLRSDQSILSQFRDPDQYPELTYLGNQFGAIQLYRDWNVGPTALMRRPQATDLPDDVLLEDASNLGLILNALQNDRSTWKHLLGKLQDAYYGIEDVTTRIQGGTVQIFVHEAGLQAPIPATRLSDGTLRYLCLLAILLHPEPPPLICLEEPELGLHPDLMPTIAGLLVDAAQRTQLIFTTHSPTLVSAFSQTPDAVVVCERDDRGSQFRRLDPRKLQDWLERYALGEIWQMGELGGTRW